MEIKKSFKADLGNKRGLLLEIGVVLALTLVVFAFSYTPKEYRIEPMQPEYVTVVQDLAPVTRPEQKQQPRKVDIKSLAQVIQIIKNTETVDTNIDVSIFDAETPIEFVATTPEEKVEDDVFITAETMPSFMDGDLYAFRTWVQQNVKFPQIALENNIQGRVVLSFVIDKDGRLTNIEVLQSPDRSLAEEAIRVLNKSPKWSPGKQRNQTVRVKFTLPVDFRVQN